MHSTTLLASLFLASSVWAAVSADRGTSRQVEGSALIHELQHGGYVLVMRHAHAPMERPGPSAAAAGNTSDERQLDAAGRSTAEAMGRAIRRLRIPVGEIWSSPTFRARETIRVAGLRQPRIAVELADQGAAMSMMAAGPDQAKWLRAKVSQAPRPGTNTLIVTQGPNVSAAFGQAAAGLSASMSLSSQSGQSG